MGRWRLQSCADRWPGTGPLMHRELMRLLIVTPKIPANGADLTAEAASLLDAQVVRRSAISGLVTDAGVRVFDATIFVFAGREDLAEALPAARRLRGSHLRGGVFALLRWPCPNAERLGLLQHFDFVFSDQTSAEEVAAVLRLRSAPRTVEDAPTPQAALPSLAIDSLHSSRKAAEAVRMFSRLFRSALEPGQFVSEFAENIRELFGISRLAVFLHGEGRPAECATSISFSPDAVEVMLFGLRGRGDDLAGVKRTSSIDPAAMARFNWSAVGAAAVISIRDRSSTLGTMVIGPPIVRPDYTDDDLHLLYYLCEEAAIALRNGATHERITKDRLLLTGILDVLTDGAMVIEGRKRVSYANNASARMLGTTLPLESRRLPSELLEQIASAPPAEACTERTHELFGRSILARLFAVDISRGEEQHLLLLEDLTAVEESKRAAVEAANAKLMALIARRCAHEIRNAVVPLTTHAQLYRAQISDPEFRSSLIEALERETDRIIRFTDQMLNFARARHFDHEGSFSVTAVIDAAFDQAKGRRGWPSTPILTKTVIGDNLSISGSYAGLTVAFFELFVNALQSGGSQAGAVVNAEATDCIRIEICDEGTGFDSEPARRAFDPFFTSRNVGVGLGLTIAREIVLSHGGVVELLPTRGPGAHVAVTLPRAPKLLPQK